MTAPAPADTTDLIHPSAFVFGQTPVYLQWAAAATSTPRALASAPFAYCDLGCGDGTTLNILAAEYPAASFFGSDPDADHLAIAGDFAARAGLRNVSFRAASFAGLAAAGLPPMDFIAAHGLYSWIDDRARDELHAFVQSHLRPGGLLSLQYSSLPGSTVEDSFFAILRRFTDRAPGDSVQRLTTGFGELQQLKAHAGFFQSIPAASALLDAFRTVPPRLLAHQVRSRRSHSFYCHEVHDAMAALGLDYAGSADPRLNHPELLMSRDAFTIFDEVTRNGGGPLRSAILDLILNTSSRVDVFRRPEAESDATSGASRLRGVANFHLRPAAGANSAAARRRASASLAVDLASPLHTAMLDAVGSEGRSVAETLASPGLEATGRAAAEKALAELVAMQQLSVMIEPARQVEHRADRRYRLASRLNSILLDETLHVPRPVAFASPVLGTALMIPVDARLRLAAWLGRDLEQVWRMLGKANRRLNDSRGRPIASYERFRLEIESTLPRFATSLVPELLRFGLLEEEA